jgi:CO dehydrogenase/acetyl-CoA synthase beta subunit
LSKHIDEQKMKNKKLNETNNIKLILSNKKLLIRKIVIKEEKKIFDYHSLSRAKAREP